MDMTNKLPMEELERKPSFDQDMSSSDDENTSPSEYSGDSDNDNDWTKRSGKDSRDNKVIAIACFKVDRA